MLLNHPHSHRLVCDSHQSARGKTLEVEQSHKAIAMDILISYDKQKKS